MTQEQQPAVVEWGSSDRLSRRTALARVFTSIRDSRLAVPVAAGLGALAIFGSLVSDWQVTNLTQVAVVGPDAADSMPPVTSGLGELSGWAGGYLMGLFALAGCTGLVLFGRPAVRDQARLLGLTSAGVLAAMLVGVAVYLGDKSVALQRVTFYIDPDELRYDTAYGPGLTMAFLGVGAFALALYLAGRALPTRPGPASAPAEHPEQATEGEDDWPWRRPAAKRGDEPETEVPQPIDLTVAPTAPFVPLPESPNPNGPKPDGK